MSDGHALLAPSFAHVWWRCAAAPTMVRDSPPVPETDAVREGHAMHWRAKVEILGEPLAPVAPNGVVIDDELQEVVDVYVQDFRAVLIEAMLEDPDVVWGVEERGQATFIHEHLCWGTNDAFVWSPRKLRLWNWDLKTGHRLVSEFEDPQQVIYVRQLLERFGIDGATEQRVRVEMRIVQPRYYRADPVRAWSCMASDLRGMWNQLKAAAGMVLAAKPFATSGPWCADCDARWMCETARKSSMSAVDYAEQATPEQLATEGLAYEYMLLERARDSIDARMSGIEPQLEARMRAGARVAGLAMQQQFGRQTWGPDITVEDVEALGQASGVDLVKKKPITPTQAKKAGMPAAVIDDPGLTWRPPGSMKMVIQDAAAIRRVIAANTRN